MDARELLSRVLSDALDTATFDQTIHLVGSTVTSTSYTFDYHAFAELDSVSNCIHVRGEAECPDFIFNKEYYQKDDTCYVPDMNGNLVVLRDLEPISAVLFVPVRRKVDFYKDLSLELADGKYIVSGKISYRDVSGDYIYGGDAMLNVELTIDEKSELLENVYVNLETETVMQGHNVQEFELNTVVSKIGSTVIDMSRAVS